MNSLVRDWTLIMGGGCKMGEGQQCPGPEATVKSNLPKLTLKQFSGDPTQWHAFWDSFSAAVHENDDVSQVDKFNYI